MNMVGGEGKRMMGLEPTTSTLARLRSTTELHPRYIDPSSGKSCGAIIRILRAGSKTFLGKFESISQSLGKTLK